MSVARSEGVTFGHRVLVFLMIFLIFCFSGISTSMGYLIPKCIYFVSNFDFWENNNSFIDKILTN